jgi:hypothetical protein
VSPHWLFVVGLGYSVAAFQYAGERLTAEAVAAAQGPGPALAESVAGAPAAAAKAWGVQLAGSFSLEQAESMFARVQDAIPDILGDRQPTIVMAPLGNRGPGGLYRLRLQFMSREDATKLCDAIQHRGQSCVVLPSNR